jgi:hypothetical protein
MMQHVSTFLRGRHQATQIFIYNTKKIIHKNPFLPELRSEFYKTAFSVFRYKLKLDSGLPQYYALSISDHLPTFRWSVLTLCWGLGGEGTLGLQDDQDGSVTTLRNVCNFLLVHTASHSVVGCARPATWYVCLETSSCFPNFGNWKSLCYNLESEHK